MYVESSSFPLSGHRRRENIRFFYPWSEAHGPDGVEVKPPDLEGGNQTLPQTANGKLR